MTVLAHFALSDPSGSPRARLYYYYSPTTGHQKPTHDRGAQNGESSFFIYDTLILTILHYITVSAGADGPARREVYTKLIDASVIKMRRSSDELG